MRTVRHRYPQRDEGVWRLFLNDDRWFEDQLIKAGLDIEAADEYRDDPNALTIEIRLKLDQMAYNRIKSLMAQVWNYVAADVPSDWKVKDCIDLLQGTDYEAIHGQDKPAAEAFRKLPEKTQRKILREVVA
jgi:hypothetical protein